MPDIVLGILVGVLFVATIATVSEVNGYSFLKSAMFFVLLTLLAWLIVYASTKSSFERTEVYSAVKLMEGEKQVAQIIYIGERKVNITENGTFCPEGYLVKVKFYKRYYWGLFSTKEKEFELETIPDPKAATRPAVEK